MSAYHHLAATQKSAASKMTLSDVKAMLPGALGDGATVGGLGGAALGGIVGAGQAVFDGEDDGMGSTLGKILGGAGKGAVGGAVVGGGVAAGKRHMAKGKVEEFLEQLRASVKAKQEAAGGVQAPKYPDMRLG